MNLKPSNRIENIEESSTLAMSAKASEMKSKGIDVISLSLGEPDFKTHLLIFVMEQKKQLTVEIIFHTLP